MNILLRDCGPCASSALLLSSEWARLFLLQSELMAIIPQAFPKGEASLEYIMDYAGKNPTSRTGVLCKQYLELYYMRAVKKQAKSARYTAGQLKASTDTVRFLIQEVEQKKVFTREQSQLALQWIMKVLHDWCQNGGGLQDYEHAVIENMKSKHPMIQKRLMLIIDMLIKIYNLITEAIFDLGFDPLIDLVDNQQLKEALTAMQMACKVKGLSSTNSFLRPACAPPVDFCAPVNQAQELFSRLVDNVKSMDTTRCGPYSVCDDIKYLGENKWGIPMTYTGHMAHSAYWDASKGMPFPMAF